MPLHRHQPRRPAHPATDPRASSEAITTATALTGYVTSLRHGHSTRPSTAAADAAAGRCRRGVVSELPSANRRRRCRVEHFERIARHPAIPTAPPQMWISRWAGGRRPQNPTRFGPAVSSQSSHHGPRHEDDRPPNTADNEMAGDDRTEGRRQSRRRSARRGLSVGGFSCRIGAVRGPRLLKARAALASASSSQVGVVLH